jgi:hypothetical protein
MRFDIVGPITEQRTIAVGSCFRELSRIMKRYAPGRWRKLAGTAWVRHADGSVRLAELPWYEAAAFGRREIKIKRYIDLIP